MPRFSIVILTYNRRERLRKQIELIRCLTVPNLEIVVVDNASDLPVDDIVALEKRAYVLRNSKNLGAVGRNSGMRAATGDIVITLDDDVYGITDHHLELLTRLFQQENVAAINFKVVEEGTGRIANWCHPCDELKFETKSFETNALSEGAVAFRRKALESVGYYPDYFFISHEGLDLASRFINAEWIVLYSPEILVAHAYEEEGRASWRRYYYDTRNLLWLVIRNYPIFYGLKKLGIGWSSNFIYSVRDGYILYWFKGVSDAIRRCRLVGKERVPLTHVATERFKFIEKNKINFLVKAKRRLCRRSMRI